MLVRAATPGHDVENAALFRHEWITFDELGEWLGKSIELGSKDRGGGTVGGAGFGDRLGDLVALRFGDGDGASLPNHEE